MRNHAPAMTFSGHDSLLLLALLAAGAGLLSLAPRLRIPYPILLVLGGLALGFVPGIPHVALNPRRVKPPRRRPNPRRRAKMPGPRP